MPASRCGKCRVLLAVQPQCHGAGRPVSAVVGGLRARLRGVHGEVQRAL